MKKASKPHRFSIEPAANGGYIVEHSFDNSNSGPSYRMPERHVVTNQAQLMKHLQKHTGGAAPTGVGTPITKKAPGPKTYGAGAD